MKNLIYIFLLVLNCNFAWANQAQPVPIPENPSTAPQIQIDGTGIGSISFSRTGESKKGQVGININDSSIFIGASQRLYQGGIGSFGLGGFTNENGILFLHQAFVDFQSESFEALIGRSDNPSGHLVDFPTLRGDDLITFTNQNRYSNVASVTYQQNFNYFENIHAQHVLNSSTPTDNLQINASGVTFQYLADPGLENFTFISSAGFGYEHFDLEQNNSGGLHQLYVGGVLNLNQSVTNLVDLRVQNILSMGSGLTNFSNLANTDQANSNSLAGSIRYLHQPFGLPGYQLSFTTAYKNYFEVSKSKSISGALTAVRRWGEGFDLVAQYQGTARESSLAAIRSNGITYEQILEIGFTFNFESTFNRHLSPRRTLLNQKNQYIPN